MAEKYTTQEITIRWLDTGEEYNVTVGMGRAGEWSDCDRHPHVECYRYYRYITDEYEYECEPISEMKDDGIFYWFFYNEKPEVGAMLCENAMVVAV